MFKLKTNLELNSSLAHVEDKEAKAAKEHNCQVLPVTDQAIHLPLTIFLACNRS